MPFLENFDRLMFYRMNDLLRDDVEVPRSNCRQQTRCSLVPAKLDLIEKPDAYAVHVDLPGVAKEDIQVHIENGALTVSAERKEELKEEGDLYRYMERRFGSIKRIVSLPEQADQESVKAELVNGVLYLVFAKKAEESSRKQVTIS
ncbi:Hsp16-like protein [Paramicrosporidium saccamoebae]|uniref:Hsp16-like protein n=1 Tax=Paramicrosporidium saccamoebae TaxID=1246581 RepID=A0A2H9TLR4_9FUNG|nr:Hsp16-like protein [Paramicrosporidium saccamoebae]